MAGGCATNDTITVSPTPTAITGNAPFCAGTTIALGDGRGRRQLGQQQHAGGHGRVHGPAAGRIGGHFGDHLFFRVWLHSHGHGTVLSSPAAITGPGAVCVGATVTEADATAGGTWTGTGAPVTGGGVVTGATAGTATITYTIADGCAATRVLTVSPLPSPITGVTAYAWCHHGAGRCHGRRHVG